MDEPTCSGHTFVQDERACRICTPPRCIDPQPCGDCAECAKMASPRPSYACAECGAPAEVRYCRPCGEKADRALDVVHPVATPRTGDEEGDPVPVGDVLEYRKLLALPAGPMRNAVEWDAALEDALDEVERLRGSVTLVQVRARELTSTTCWQTCLGSFAMNARRADLRAALDTLDAATDSVSKDGVK